MRKCSDIGGRDLAIPFTEFVTWVDFNAGIGTTEMLGRANYIALVGGGKRPRFPQNKVGKTVKPRLHA